MTYYSLLIVARQKRLSTPARDRHEALVIFGKELGVALTLEGGDAVAVPYLLDEWEGNPHWVDHTIPVFEMRVDGADPA